jgi:hypothetical protein
MRVLKSYSDETNTVSVGRGSKSKNAIKEEYLNSLFTGKRAKNNEKILDRLLTEPKRLNRNQISRRIGVAYETGYGRVEALEKLGLVEVKEPTNRYGLTAEGLWVQAQRREVAREKCSEIIQEAWKEFDEIYDLSGVKTREPYYELLKSWLRSDEGLLDFLDTFGSETLGNQEQALLAFRRMLDLGLLNQNMDYTLTVFRSDTRLGETSIEPTQALAAIAREHKLFSKLHRTLREVDAPLYAHINKAAHDALTLELVKALPLPVAQKLASTPIFAYQPAIGATASLDHVTSDSLQKTLNEVKRLVAGRPEFMKKTIVTWPFFKIVIEDQRVSLVTDRSDWPQRISSEWMEYCDIYVIRKERGKVVVDYNPSRRSAQ